MEKIDNWYKKTLAMIFFFGLKLEVLYLSDNFVNGLLTLDATKSYLRKQIKAGRIVTQILKSAAITTFQKKNVEKSPFLTSFCLSSSK